MVSPRIKQAFADFYDRWVHVADFYDRWVHGICCAAPSGNPGRGAFHWWRCGLPRGHDGLHRTGNYDWPAKRGGFTPEKGYVPSPDRSLGVLTRRQRRERQEWDRKVREDRQRRAKLRRDRVS